MGKYSGPIAAVREIIRTEGARGLFVGYDGFLLRDLPFDAIEFVAYEQLKIGYNSIVHRPPSTIEASLIGAIAGAITGTSILDCLVLCINFLYYHSGRI